MATMTVDTDIRIAPNAGLNVRGWRRLAVMLVYKNADNQL